MLRNKKQSKYIVISGFGLLLVSLIFLLGFDFLWNKWDLQATDYLYSRLVKLGKGPKPSPKIVYLDITDETYKNFSEWIGWLRQEGIDPADFTSQDLENLSSHQISFPQFCRRLERRLDDPEGFRVKLKTG